MAGAIFLTTAIFVNMTSRKGFVTWGLAALFFLYEFLLRTSLGTFQQPIMCDLQLSSVSFSLISTSFPFLASSCMQIPGGFFARRYGLKKPLLVGSTLCALSAIGLSYSPSFAWALICRITTGIGASFGFLCLVIAIYTYLPTSNKASWIGISQFIGTLGPMLSAGPLHALAEQSALTWRQITLKLGIIGLLLALVILIFVENRPQHTPTLSRRAPFHLKQRLKDLFPSPQVGAIALFSGFVYFSIEYLSENEGQFFLCLKGLTPFSASYMITTAWIGYALGAPLLGIFSDLYQRRKPFLLLVSGLGVGALLCIWMATDPVWLFLAFFLLGIATSGQTVSFACMVDQFPPENKALGISLNNGTIAFTVALCAPLISFVLDTSSHKATPTLADYHVAFYPFIGLALLPFFLSLFGIKEALQNKQRTPSLTANTIELEKA